MPPLRRLLLRPFRRSLLADADIDHLESASYFGGSDVRTEGTGTSLPVTDAIPEIRGQIVLEGESGLGKSLFLRRLTSRAKRTTVFLPARRCEAGVLPAIQNKLLGIASDEAFLQALVYSGALDVVIDGLNEVSADTRGQISNFVQQYFTGNVVLATQPMEWQPPSTASVFTLLPLDRKQIEAFLVSRSADISPDSALTGQTYEKKARAFLARIFDAASSDAAKEAFRKVLSNPMDASTVAQILSNDEEANLLTLQTQAFEIMASDYASRNEGREFPLERFSERVYRMRNEDQVTIDDSEFKDEILAMERHKMLLRRVELSDEEGERREVAKWRFRHDKVMDFFLYQAFFDPNEGPKRQVEHISDPRFRGVYLLMATRAPAQIAHELERRLILHAAKTGDHSLSDAFVTLLSERTFETVES